MKAVVCEAHGGPDQLKLADVSKPIPGAGEILVKTAGVGLNRWDVKVLSGETGMKVKFPYVPGVEFSGTVEALGDGVTEFQVGDCVFGTGQSTLAEYCCASASVTVKASGSLDLPFWGAVPVASMTAWQAIHRVLQVKAGQRVLIHAAAGGVGTFAVQIARLAGAYVIGTASAENLHYIKQLGADEAIDYKTTQFEDVLTDVDAVLDTLGGVITEKSRKVLKKGGILAGLTAPFDEQAFHADGKRAVYFSMKPNPEDLAEIRDLIEDMKLESIVTEQVGIDRTARAFEELAKGHMRGKMLILVS